MYGLEDVVRDASDELHLAILTSYCPDGRAASDRILASRACRKVLYDLDTPVTLERVASGESVIFPMKGSAASIWF